jgi:hypothetical protein
MAMLLPHHGRQAIRSSLTSITAASPNSCCDRKDATWVHMAYARAHTVHQRLGATPSQIAT